MKMRSKYRRRDRRWTKRNKKKRNNKNQLKAFSGITELRYIITRERKR
jgi:hypothetical protein